MKLRAVVLGLLLVVGATRGLRAEDDHPVMRFTFELGHPAPVAPENISPEQLNAAVLVETNRVRLANGLRPLRPLPALAAAADDQAAFMALTLQVTHAGMIRGQRNAAERVKSHGLTDAAFIAENVLSTGLASLRETSPSCAEVAAAIVAQWMASPDHRANLLNREFTHLGCATRRASFVGGERIFATQVFAAR